MVFECGFRSWGKETVTDSAPKTPPTPTPQAETRVVAAVKEVDGTNTSATNNGGGSMLGTIKSVGAGLIAR